jgi:hypothetical protein
MLPDSPLVRRILGISAVVIVVAALAAVVVVSSGGDDDSVEAGARSPSTTRAPAPTTAPPATEGEGAAGDDTGDAGSGAPPAAGPSGTVQGSGGEATTGSTQPATAGGGGDDLGAPEDPGPSTPPQAGTYSYTATRQSDGGTSESRDTETTIADTGSDGGERRQSITIEGPEGSAVIHVAWRSDGLYVTSMTIGGSDCDWEPDFRWMAAPLQPGATWSYASSCTATFGATPVKLDRTGEFKVVELVRMRVAGEVVDVWKIESTEETTAAGFGGSREVTTTYFSPRHGLRVKSTTERTSEQQGQTTTSVEASEIKSLSPQ